MNIRVSAIFVALLAALAGTAAAQVANTGTIQVTVEDSDGGRLPGVTVTATATDTITKRTAVTDPQGVASLEALAPSAQYLITVELAGFQTGTRPAVLVRAGQTTSIAFTLAVAGVDRGRRGDGSVAGRRREERDQRPGHHPAADRVAADRPELPELPAAGARRAARRSDPVGQSGGALGHELQRHRAGPWACRPTTSTTSTA